MIDKLLSPLKQIPGLVTTSVFSLNHDAFTPLEQHLGKVIQIHLEDTKQSYYLQIEDHSIHWIAPTNPDLKVFANAYHLAKLINAPNDVSQLIQHNITVLGDIPLLQDMSTSLKLARPDIAQILSSLSTDLVANTIISGFEKSTDFLKNLVGTRTQDFADYASIEKDMLVTQMEYESFEQSVLKLRDEVDKLKSRVQKYKSVL
jgi:ubiquinone biosynthesis protein UbiJ